MKKPAPTNGLPVDCPLPDTPSDVITLGHGSGGQLTNRLLDEGVFQRFDNAQMAERHDGAVLELKGKLAFSTDSFVVDPIFFPGGDIGDLAVNGTVNDLAMCGAIPKYLSLGFILEEGLPMADFNRILSSIHQAAQAAEVEIVTGDTKVVDRGKGDKVFINTTGIGEVHPKADISFRRVEVGDKIIVSGNLAAHGIAIMSVREGLEFDSDIKSDTAPLNKLVAESLHRFGSDIHLLRDPTRGGIATVLNEIARQSGTGVEISEDLLPMDQQVIAACELLGLEPLFVANEGIFVATVAPAIADDLVKLLHQFDEGKAAACIGEVVDEHPGQLVMRSVIGGKRLVNMLVGEQLPRIC